MAEPKPKILLVNYSEKDAENIRKSTVAEVFRGYISDGGIFSHPYTGKAKEKFDYYFPIPPYECSAVFVNLDNYADNEDEFNDKQLDWTERDTKNLHDYWKRENTLLVYFVGETKVSEMYNFAVPVTLVNSSGVDTEANVTLDKRRTHRGLFDELNKLVIMPNKRYLNVPRDDALMGLGTSAYFAIKNRNSDILSVVFTKERHDSNLEGVGIIVLPQPKKLAEATKIIYKHFDDGDSVQSWADGDDFYPSDKIDSLKQEIENIIERAKTAVETRRAKLDEHRKDYSYLKDLVTSQDEVLVEAVFKVLSEVLGLKVVKSDEVEPGNPKEDLLATYQGKDILLEVKGTNRQNPALKYTQQPMQHALRRGLKDAGVGLILNHDFNTQPEKRKLAYNDKETRPLIAEMYFIDTTVLLRIAKNVLDGNLTIEDATAKLFGKVGRISH